MGKYDMLEEKMCKELDMLEDKYRNGMELAEADLKRIDCLAHALKSLATYKAMREAEEYGEMSGRRGRSMTTGRYISRDMDPGYEPRGWGYNGPHW